MDTLVRLLRLWDNPVFQRFRRSQLRLKVSLFWLLATVIVATFVISLNYIVDTNLGMPAKFAARNQWFGLLVFQGLILMIKGTGKTSSGVIQDKIDQTLDYQRLTAVPPLANVAGYLFGLPLLEYCMFALTLPHLAFIVIRGEIPLATVASVYTAFFVCTIFYHTTAVAVGMVMRRWIFGYLLSIFAVACLNLIIAPLGSRLGLKFLQFLSIYPVLGEKVLPLQSAVPAIREVLQNLPQGPPSANPIANFISGDPVAFFDWTLSPFVVTLALQAGLIATFATMAVRRWEKADKHSLSKPFALGVLTCFVILVTGNLWPVITRQYMPFAIFGIRSFDVLQNPLAIALPLVFVFASWLLCIFLFFNTVPSHHSYVRGVRRARKLGRKAARFWDDDASSLAFMSLFVAVALAGLWLLLHEMEHAGFMNFVIEAGGSLWRLPLVFALVLTYTLLVLLVLGNRGAVMSFLLLWFLPILVAIVSGAAMKDITNFQTITASLSPIATILMAGLLPLDNAVPIDPGDGFDVVHTGFATGLVFLLVQIAVLAYRWTRLRRSLV